MEGSIQILPPEVVDRIAAGEVVERPSSVIKELLENALDAGASFIRIRAGEGGIGYMEVEDDGEGMVPQEVRLSVQRHATSKIRRFEDLYVLRTFGFRGEALSSIASVSRMEIRSRKRGSLEGVRLVVEGGDLRELQPWGCPSGTAVRVEDLFFNVPARRKFLRSHRTEAQHLRETVAKIALVYWKVGFQYEYEGREILSLPPASDWRSRAARIFGEENFEHLYPVYTSEGEIEVQGLLPHPNQHRRGAGGLWFFVNGRWVQDRGLLHAVLQGYGSLLERGRYPLGAILLQMPPDEVDVNVHPTKREVRFRSPQKVYPLVTAAVRSLLKEQPWVPEAIGKMETERQGALPISEPSSPFLSAGLPPERAPSGEPLALISSQIHQTMEVAFLGQMEGTYLIFQTPNGLLILDQHAAHERILFHRLRTQWTSGGMVRGQEVLFPQVVEVPSELGEVLDGLIERLSRLGWGIEPFGGGTWRIRSLPPWMDPSRASHVLMEIVEACAGMAVEGEEEVLMESVLSTLACHGAIRAGRRMGSQEALDLLRQLEETPGRGLCPHGRPTLVEIPLKELHRRFGRV